jgi:anti-sigma B factor antagonist
VVTTGRVVAAVTVTAWGDFPQSGDSQDRRSSLGFTPVTDAPQFEVFINGDGVCIVRGELDEFTGAELESTLRNRPDVATIDLGEVSFVDSAGLRALLIVRRERTDAGGTVGVRRSSGAVRRVMRLAGVAHLFAHEHGRAAEPGSTAAG